MPWVRALGMMRDGTADLMSGLARTQERETFILYQAPAYAEIRPAFYQLATNAQLVDKAVTIIESMGARVIGPAEVREKLKLTKRAPRG